MADTAFTNIFTRLQAIFAAVTGINYASKTALENVGEFPAMLIYPSRGEVTGQDSSTLQGIHTITVLLMLSRGDLASAETDIRPLVESVYKALWADPTLGSTQSYKPGLIGMEYTYGPITYGNTPLLVCRFDLDIKLRQPNT
jgi:hypothetical protein